MADIRWHVIMTHATEPTALALQLFLSPDADEAVFPRDGNSVHLRATTCWWP
jgi:hypothetical protein